MIPDKRVFIVMHLPRNAGFTIAPRDFDVDVFETAQLAENWFEVNKYSLQWARFSRTSLVRHIDGSYVQFISKRMSFDYETGEWVRDS